MIKNIFILPFLWIALIVLGLVLYLLSYLPAVFSGRYYHYLTRLWCKIFIRSLAVDLRLIEKNTQPIPQQYILIANHPSALEDFAVPALFDIYPLAKAGVRDWFVLGRISDYAGTVFVERNNPGSRHAALETLIDAARSGKNLIIFPEGGCKGQRIYKQFKTGAFEISMQTGISVLPVFLQYVDQDAFEWKDETLPKKLWQIFMAKNKRVNYYLHDAIAPDQFRDKEYFAEHTRKQYLEWQQKYLD